MKRISFFTIAICLTACSGRTPHKASPQPEAGVAPAEPPAAAAQVSGGVPWGEAGRQVEAQTPVSLRSRVRLAARPDDTEPAVEVGASLLLIYEIQNNGSSPVGIWHSGFWPNHRILVRDAKGEEAPLTPFGKTAVEAFDPRGAREKNVEWPLEPGAIDATEGAYDLAKLYELTLPGRYSVRVDYEEEILVRSNTLTFWLLPVGAAEPLAKLESWDREECDVAERPAAYPGRVASGETNGYLDTQKAALRELGVEVRWDAAALHYRVQAIKPTQAAPTSAADEE